MVTLAYVLSRSKYRRCFTLGEKYWPIQHMRVTRWALSCLSVSSRFFIFSTSSSGPSQGDFTSSRTMLPCGRATEKTASIFCACLHTYKPLYSITNEFCQVFHGDSRFQTEFSVYPAAGFKATEEMSASSWKESGGKKSPQYFRVVPNKLNRHRRHWWNNVAWLPHLMSEILSKTPWPIQMCSSSSPLCKCQNSQNRFDGGISFEHIQGKNKHRSWKIPDGAILSLECFLVRLL